MFKRVLRDSMTRFVGQSVGQRLLFRRFPHFRAASAQMHELALFIAAPAHPHATLVAVYPALFFSI